MARALDEERARLVLELQEGESRLARLREAAAIVREAPVPQPVLQSDPGARLEETIFSFDTFKKKRCHPMTLSSNTFFQV